MPGDVTSVNYPSFHQLDPILTLLHLPAQASLSSLEQRSLSGADERIVSEVRQLREEKEGLVRGMANLHTIIERGQGEQEQARQRLEQEQEAGQELRRQLDAIGQRMEQEAGQELRRQEEQTSQRLEQESSQELRRQLDGQEQELEKAKIGLLELGKELQARQEAVRELEGRLASTGRSLRSKEEEVSSLLQTQLLAQGSSNTTELMQEKHELERQLEKVTLDMAGVEKVVTEMTRSFRHQVQSKEAEVRGERERCQGLERINRDLELRCTDLDTAVKVRRSS